MRLSVSVIRAAVAAAALLVAVSGVGAQGNGGLLPGANGVRKADGGVTTCTARNALATKQCTTTCPAGQNADCEDGDDGSDPTCTCSTE